MWMIGGLLVLGLLVGNLVGLTAQSVVTSLLGLLFAFIGGSVIALLGKLAPADRRLAGQCVVALSLGCLIGTYVGIGVSEHQLLTPKNQGAAAVRSAVADRKYLRSAAVETAEAIDMQYAQGLLSGDEAFRQLLTAVRRAEASGRQP